VFLDDANTSKLSQKALEYLLATPKALLFAICSFFSGQLWLFVIFAYYSNNSKGKTFLNNKYGKTALGACWFTVFLIPIYLLRFRTWRANADDVMSVLLETILAGAFCQTMVFAILTFKNSTRK
jgi:hypothetical protein